MDEDRKLGFIIIRHVNSIKTNLYWILCYKSIRQFYSNKIVIIDDNSNNEFINYDFQNNLTNCIIINSEYKGSGEILAYYYYYINNFFDKAVIIHDSTFIQSNIDFEIFNDIKFLWHFDHYWDKINEDVDLIHKLDLNILQNYFEKNKWKGCFGLQSVIDYNFLKKISEKYNLFSSPRLFELVNKRNKRMIMERIFALICTIENKNLENDPSIFGRIHSYIKWGYTFDTYINHIINKNKIILKYPIIKVWSGR